MNKILNILSEYQLKIEKRIDTITCFDINLYKDNEGIQIKENYNTYMVAQPEKKVYYLFQYEDIIYKTTTLEEMFDYIKNHFKLDN